MWSTFFWTCAKHRGRFFGFLNGLGNYEASIVQTEDDGGPEGKKVGGWRVNFKPGWVKQGDPWTAGRGWVRQGGAGQSLYRRQGLGAAGRSTAGRED